MMLTGNFYGFLFHERGYAEKVAKILQRMTGEVCAVHQRGVNDFLVIRNHGVIA